MSKDDGLAPDGRSGSSEQAPVGRWIYALLQTLRHDVFPVVLAFAILVPMALAFVGLFFAAIALIALATAVVTGISFSASLEGATWIVPGGVVLLWLLWPVWENTKKRARAACSEAEATQREGEARSQPQHPKE